MLAPKNLMKQLYNFFRRKASVCEARQSARPCKACVLPLDKRIALCYNTTNTTGKLRRMLLSNTTKPNKAKRTLLLVVVAAFATLVVFSLFFTGYEQGARVHKFRLLHLRGNVGMYAFYPSHKEQRERARSVVCSRIFCCRRGVVLANAARRRHARKTKSKNNKLSFTFF